MSRLPHRGDWAASLVVFVVALPLCLGISLASGAPLASGLITAVIGGIVCGAVSGAPLVATGPAAGLTALVFQLINQYGLVGLGLITFLCGGIQTVLGVSKLGGLFARIPVAVLEGVLSAIGLIIVIGQLHVLTGAGVPKSAVVGLAGLPQAFASPHWPALVCGAAGIALQLIWPRIASKHRWLSVVPGALPAVVVTTVALLGWALPRVELTALLPTAFAATQGIARQVTSVFDNGSILTVGAQWLMAAIGVAVVASAETLLTARAVDTMAASRPRHIQANLNRELVAQGLGNAVSGLVGGLPMTGVIVRSAANVNAGAQTRWSTILHGIWFAAFVGLAPSVLEHIPLAALAAILIVTGVKLLNLRHLTHTLRHSPSNGAVWLLTSASIFATDLLKGLVLGLATAGIVFSARRFGILPKTSARR